MNTYNIKAMYCFIMVFATCASLRLAGPVPHVVLAFAPPNALAQTSIQLEPVLTGLASPVYVTNAHDGSHRLFILEQSGRIQVLQPGAASPTVFLDITTKVLSGGERGLLGLAFHPQFASNGRFFVNYTARQPVGALTIAEYHVSTTNPNSADPNEILLLSIPHASFSNHNGGMTEFGPDGYLYIGTGDGGNANDMPDNNAQNPNVLLGKILRIDVDHSSGAQLYSAPPTNPFFGATPGRDEIYALGLRNPWRFSFDRATGELYVGDVGQGAHEEIDIVTVGGNYGWRVYEGNTCTGNDPGLCNPNNFSFPIVDYPTHQGARCAVTGGYVYRGARSSLPVGSYVFGDYCSGEIFLFQNGAMSLLLDTALNISSFGEDERGEIYVVGLGGTVHWIRNGTLPNLVANAGFEAGNTSWDDLGNATAVAVQAHSGSNSLRVGAGAGGRSQLIANATANTSYTLSGWGKVGAIGETGLIGATVEDSFGQQHIHYFVITETAYTQKSVSFTTPPDTVSLAVWAWKSAGLASFFFVDDLSLIASPAPPNLLSNPGFESGDIFWQDQGNSRAVQSNMHSGMSAMEVGPGAGGRAQLIVDATATTSYTLSGWGKVGTAGQSGLLGVTVEDSFGQQYYYSFAITETAYTQKSVSFTTPPDTVSLAVWMWKSAGIASFFFVDDLSLAVSME